MVKRRRCDRRRASRNLFIATSQHHL